MNGEWGMGGEGWGYGMVRDACHVRLTECDCPNVPQTALDEARRQGYTECIRILSSVRDGMGSVCDGQGWG